MYVCMEQNLVVDVAISNPRYMPEIRHWEHPECDSGTANALLPSR